MSDLTRNEIKIVADDVKVILAEAIADYEQRTGKTLQPAHIERSLIQTYAYRELLVRKGINEAFLQTFPQFATGVALDLCGEPMGCYRNDGEDDDTYRKRILLTPEAFTTCGTRGSYEYHTYSVSSDIADVYVSTPQGGVVQIAVLAKTGVPSADLVANIQAYVSDEKRRTLCDTVNVMPATKVDYQIVATLDLLETANEIDTLANAKTALQAYLNGRGMKMGQDVVPLDLKTALKVAGVYNVSLAQPALVQVVKGAWANCTAIHLTANRTRQEG